MTIKTIDIKGNLRSGGTDIDKLRPANVERASQFVSYQHLYGDSNSTAHINVESTARTAMAGILCLPVEVQARIFYFITMLVKNPGDQAILADNDKTRGARVVRLASDKEGVVNLLLTH